MAELVGVVVPLGKSQRLQLVTLEDVGEVDTAKPAAVAMATVSGVSSCQTPARTCGRKTQMGRRPSSAQRWAIRS